MVDQAKETEDQPIQGTLVKVLWYFGALGAYNGREVILQA
jgi:hypothetical protein